MLLKCVVCWRVSVQNNPAWNCINCPWCSKNGAYRGPIGQKNLGDFRFFSWYFIVLLGFFGVYIFPKWLKKVPGHFGILFRWFWELRKCCQNLVPEPSGLSPKCFKKYKKSYGIILVKYYVCQSGTSNNSKLFGICLS